MLRLHPADESLWLSKHVLEYHLLHTAHVEFLLPMVCFSLSLFTTACFFSAALCDHPRMPGRVV